MGSARECTACHQPHEGRGLQCETCRTGSTASSGPATAAAAPSAPAPERFSATLPWSALASDNRNVSVTGRKEDRDRFATAKARAREILQEAYGDRQPSDGPVRVTAALYVPDRRVLDPPNFSKCLLDALKGIVITDDRWTVLRWFEIGVAGVDVDRPRCELTMEPCHENDAGHEPCASRVRAAH